LGQDSKIGCTNSSSGIPTRSSVKSTKSTLAATGLGVVAINNIIKCVRCGGSSLIDPRIEESQSRFSGIEADIIEESNDSGKSRRRSRSSTNRDSFTTIDNLEVNISESRNIRSSTSGAVKGASRGLGDIQGKISINGRCLPIFERICIGESSTRTESLDGSFISCVSCEESGSSYTGNVRSGSWERRIEFTSSRSFCTVATRTRVTAGKDYAYTSKTNLLEFDIKSELIIIGRIVSLGTVTDGVDPWKRSFVIEFVVPSDEIIPEVKVLHGIKPGSGIWCNSSNILNIERGLNSR